MSIPAKALIEKTKGGGYGFDVWTDTGACIDGGDYERLTDAAKELQEIRDDDQEFPELFATVAQVVKLRDAR